MRKEIEKYSSEKKQSMETDSVRACTWIGQTMTSKQLLQICSKEKLYY